MTVEIVLLAGVIVLIGHFIKGFSGLIILFFSPLFLFDVGFQLSFASVFGILLR